MNRLSHVLLIALGLLLLAAGPAAAQERHTLVIRDGQVWIDDQRVPPADLPPSLVLDGVEAQFSFVGDAVPLLDVDGTLYALEDGRLQEVTDAAMANAYSTVRFRDGRLEMGGLSLLQPQSEAFARQAQALRLQAQSLGGEADLMRKRAEQLLVQQQALGERYRQQLESMQMQALTVSEAAQMLPRLQVHTYFDEVQQQNRALYQSLVDELYMEAESQRLAAEIQQLAEGAERQQRIEALLERLNAMFEIKQANRRREIEQLEAELNALQKRLGEREAHREQIIRQRLKDLIGGDH
ncbi:MAG: hypothetical protein R3247_08860 [Rhodothermales bacterium]|nr:hypothetical protein [Rhodothermales bacterium]